MSDSSGANTEETHKRRVEHVCHGVVTDLTEDGRCPTCGLRNAGQYREVRQAGVDPSDPCMSCGGVDEHHEPKCWFA